MKAENTPDIRKKGVNMRNKHQRRTALLAVVIAGLMLLPAPVSAQTYREHLIIPFTIPYDGPCSQLPDGLVVSGTADLYVVTTVRVDQNGVTHVNINSRATGTATDNEGGAYKFNYSSHRSEEVPPGETNIQVNWTDHFNLVGAGRTIQVHTGFVLRGTITESGFEMNFINTYGDPFKCDPI
jgi:hypothetical protein